MREKEATAFAAEEESKEVVDMILRAVARRSINDADQDYRDGRHPQDNVMQLTRLSFTAICEKNATAFSTEEKG